MKFRKPQNWSELSQLKGLLFFVQRLDELTDPYTLDSYKSPTTSIQGLIGEAIALLKEDFFRDGDDQERQSKSAEYVASELRLRLSGNWVAKSLSSVNVDKLLERHDVRTQRQEKVRDLEILQAELQPELYIARIVEDVISLSSNDHGKLKLEFLAREMISVLQDRGLSRDHINSAIISEFFSDAVVDEKTFKRFCQRVYPHRHRYRVLLGASQSLLTLDADVLDHVGIDVFPLEIDDPSEVKALPDVELIADDVFAIDGNSGRNDGDKEAEDGLVILDEVHSQALVDDDATECLAIVKVEATDYHSAVSSSLARLESVFNFYRVFDHKAELKVTNFSVVEQACCENVFRRIDLPGNTMHFTRDPRPEKASGRLRKFKDTISLDVGPDRRKFQNIINIHGMSVTSSSADVQLVNLWTCLETIAPADRKNSKISNVVGRVVPVLMLGYFSRLVANLLFDVIRWSRKELVATLKKIENSNPKNLRADFIRLISLKENEEALQSLYDKFGDFSLLRFRMHSLREIFLDKEHAHERLSSHERMVTWQLHRIYRTRNSIVHSGDSPKFTKFLVENAHEYFDQAFDFCLNLSAWKVGYNTFLSCFDYAEAQYLEYKAALDTKDPNSICWNLPRQRDPSFIFSDND
jgi:hypothetical protein